MTKKLSIQAPKIPKVLAPIIWDDYRLDEDGLNNVTISDTQITNLDLTKIKVDSVVFTNVLFTNTSFPYAEFTDVIFDKCDLSNVDFTDAVFHRVQMRECKILGINLSGTMLRNILFDRSFADYASFRFSDCKQVRFNHSSLLHSDFYEAKFAQIEFEQCLLNFTNFGAVNLRDVDLSTCTFESLIASTDKLAGCIITSEQAVGFAKMLGMIFKDELDED